MNLKQMVLSVAAFGAFLACCGAPVPEKLPLSDSDLERVLLNDTSSLGTAKQKSPMFALSYDALPEGAPWALEILKKKNSDGYWSFSFPATRVASVEYFYRVAAVDRPSKLVFQIGDRETYNQSIRELRPEDAGKWVRYTFRDGRVRELGGLRWRTEPADAALHLQLAGVTLVTPDGSRISALQPGPERFFWRFRIPDDFDSVSEMPELNGRIIVGFAGGLCSRKEWRRILYEMKKRVPNLAAGPVWGFQGTAAARNELVEHGFPIVYQSNESNDIDDYLAWHRAMGTNSRGTSRNRALDRSAWLPGEWYHGGDYGHPALFDAQCTVIDRLAGIGVKENLYMDAAWWEDTSAGFSEADRVAFVRCLEGRDDGIDWMAADGTEIKLKFPDYFAHCFGLRPTPAELGLRSFADFKAPFHQPQPGDSAERKYTYAVFHALKRYLMLDFYSRLGKYGAKKGVRVTCMPLNCSAFGQGMARSDGLQALHFDFEDTSTFFHPYIGELGTPAFRSGDGGCIALFHRGPVWSALRGLAGKRYWSINESGGGGQSVPYRDPRVNYLLQYANCAIMRPEVYHCDFLDSWTSRGLPTWEKMNDPKQKFHYARHADMQWAMEAANTAMREKPEMTETAGASVSFLRSADTFFLKRDEGSLGRIAGERLHYPWLAMSPDQSALPLFGRCRVLFFEMRGHTGEQLEILLKFLDGASGRAVVFDGPALGHRFTGADLQPVKTGEDFSLNDPTAGKPFGIDAVLSAETPPEGNVQAVSGFTPAAPPVHPVKLAGPYYTYRGRGIEPVITVGGKTVVSMLKTRGGSNIYLLHYLSRGSVSTRRLDEFVAAAILTRHGIRPHFSGGNELIALPMTLPLADGTAGRVVFAHDARKLREYVYSGNNRASYYGFDSEFAPQSLMVPGLSGRTVVYDFLAGGESRTTAGSDLTLTLDGQSAAMWYLLPDTPAGHGKLAELRAAREKLGRTLTPELIDYLITRKE